MEHKIYIIISLSREIKKKLSKHTLKLPDLPIHWTKRENLQISLSFLGKIKDESISEIINSVEEVSANHKPFFLELNRICYGPTEENPKMVLARGVKSKEIGKLKNDLEGRLLSIPKQKPSIFKEGLSPYVTLGRIKKSDFRKIEVEERPLIDKTISIKFEVNSIDIMECEIESTGAQYTLLQSIGLGKNQEDLEAW